MADLITLSQYKTIVAKTSTKDDDIITATIPGASKLVKTYCNREFIDFYAVDKVEYFSFDWGQEVVFLQEIPIVSLVMVEERESPSKPYVELVNGTDYVLDTRMDAIYRIRDGKSGRYYHTGINSVRVTYKGGFAAVPEDIVLAMADLVTYYINNEYVKEKTNLSFTVRTPGTSSKQNNADFPDHIKRVLDQYRNNV